jgi:hypothetical protein
MVVQLVLRLQMHLLLLILMQCRLQRTIWMHRPRPLPIVHGAQSKARKEAPG